MTFDPNKPLGEQFPDLKLNMQVIYWERQIAELPIHQPEAGRVRDDVLRVVGFKPPESNIDEIIEAATKGPVLKEHGRGPA